MSAYKKTILNILLMFKFVIKKILLFIDFFGSERCDSSSRVERKRPLERNFSWMRDTAASPVAGGMMSSTCCGSRAYLRGLSSAATMPHAVRLC